MIETIHRWTCDWCGAVVETDDDGRHPTSWHCTNSADLCAACADRKEKAIEQARVTSMRATDKPEGAT